MVVRGEGEEGEGREEEDEEEEKSSNIATVPAPLKGAPYIQKLFFGPLDYHIKNT